MSKSKPTTKTATFVPLLECAKGATLDELEKEQAGKSIRSAPL
ncbi:hypothetical protein [Erythrobacter sp. YT30]|nr:hypothetical protein [Erythrobacter sp. YT30]